MGKFILAIDKKWGLSLNINKALMLANREVATFVYDAVNLEGIAFTLPEIQTLLEGITVGGHKLSDQQIAVNQGKAWRFLFDSVKKGNFELSKEYVCKLHFIAGKEETLEGGKFRTGGVTIAGTNYLPPEQKELDGLFDKMSKGMDQFNDIYDQAIYVFLEMARKQFFYDVNKRMGRFMMNGVLLANGYPAINLPAKKQLEFNQLMLNFYDSNDVRPMNAFMRSCLDSRVINIMNES